MNLRRISKQELENYLRAPSLFKKKLEIWCKSESNNDAFCILIKHGLVFYIYLQEASLPLEILFKHFNLSLLPQPTKEMR